MHSIRIKVANVATQKGNLDCGLNAIVVMTSVAHNNPVNVVYNQQEIRIHLRQCFKKEDMQKFPIPRQDEWRKG